LNFIEKQGVLSWKRELFMYIDVCTQTENRRGKSQWRAVDDEIDGNIIQSAVITIGGAAYN
jgi:hypothetical protein